MLYLILQTTALFFGTYFIGTFIGSLLRKFFHMLLGSNDKMAIAGASAVAGAAGVASRDLKLFTDGKNAKVARTLEEQSHVPGQKVGASLPSDISLKGSKVTSPTNTVHLETIEQLPTHETKRLKKRGFWSRWFGGPTEKIITKQAKVQTGLPVNNVLDSSKDILSKVSVPAVAAVTATTAAIATAVLDDPKVETQTTIAPTVNHNTLTKTSAPVTGQTVKTDALQKTTLKKGIPDIKTATVSKTASTTVNETKTPKKQGFWSRWFGNSIKRTDGISRSTKTTTVAHDSNKIGKPKVALPVDKILDSGKSVASKITIPAVGAVTAAAATIATTLKDESLAQAKVIKSKIADVKVELPEVKTELPDIKTKRPDVKTKLPDVKLAATPEIPTLADNKLDMPQPDAILAETMPNQEAAIQEIKDKSSAETKTVEISENQPTEIVTSKAVNTTTLAGTVLAMTDDIIPITDVQGDIIKTVKDVVERATDKDA